MPDELSPPRSRERRILLGVMVVLLIAFGATPVIRLNRFRSRLEESMSRSLGRAVSVRAVYLRLLPRPGFELKDFAIQEDPAFGSEPMLRSGSVAARLRLSSLWRGRMEIASLSFSQPSLNLVRARDGRWNAEAVLVRASQIPSAPTARTRAESRPRFPYIEAGGGRINFKFGDEKKVFFVSDAAFALWLAAENEWNMRLSGRPVRSDASLGDTGRLSVSGSFRRSSNLSATPFKVEGAWDNAQLGQLTQLLYGRDRGWRGAVNAHATLSGSPVGLAFTAEARVSDFRRYDIAQLDSINLAAGCEGRYRRLDPDASPLSPGGNLYLQCEAPIARGMVLLRGHAGAPHDYNFDVILDKLPLSALADLARHLKRGLPADLKASGNLSGSLEFRPAAASGSLVASDVTLRSATGRVHANTVILALAEPGVRPSAKNSSHASSGAPANSAVLRLLPVNLALGGNSPLVVSGHASLGDYSVEMKGDSDCERLLNLLQILSLPPPERLKMIQRGELKVDLRASGRWQGFAPPVTSGSLRLLPSTAARASIK